MSPFTHYRMNYFLWRSLFAYTWIKLTVYPVLSGFQPPNFTQVFLQPSSTCLWLKPHPPINVLAIVTALCWQPLAHTGIKASPLEMAAMQGERTVFFVHKRTAVAYSEPIKVFPKRSPEIATLSAPFGCTHPPPLILPFLLKQRFNPFPDVARYIQHETFILWCHFLQDYIPSSLEFAIYHTPENVGGNKISQIFNFWYDITTYTRQ